MTAGPRLLVALSIVLAAIAAALHWLPPRAHDEAEPMPQTFAARCALRGTEAGTHARALEQRARLHGQRAPFELDEGQRATELFAEAEACYRAAGDRSGTQRSASERRRHQAELAQRDAAQQIERALDGGKP